MTARPASARARAAWPDIGRVELAGLLAALAAAVLLAWLSAARPADMPVWAPWEFSWTQFLAAILGLGWYARGVALADAGAAPNVWRQAAFVLGVVSIYAVLLTHFEYMAQHMFFLNRLQHMVMHHVGPFLVALSWPGETLYRGMPAPLRRVFDHPALHRAMRIVQQPALAGVLFAGLICLWLLPTVHFRAMIDRRLYDVMNWSMVIDGLLFWFLVLDPRPAPPARTSFAVRMIVTIAVMFPQIIAGSLLTFSTRTLYSYYDLCGRLYPSLGALVDQHLGGAIVWIPSAMMSSIAFMLILNNIRLNEEREAAEETDVDDAKNVVFASRWTGR